MIKKQFIFLALLSPFFTQAFSQKISWSYVDAFDIETEIPKYWTNIPTIAPSTFNLKNEKRYAIFEVTNVTVTRNTDSVSTEQFRIILPESCILLQQSNLLRAFIIAQDHMNIPYQNAPIIFVKTKLEQCDQGIAATTNNHVSTLLKLQIITLKTFSDCSKPYQVFTIYHELQHCKQGLNLEDSYTGNCLKHKEHDADKAAINYITCQHCIRHTLNRPATDEELASCGYFTSQETLNAADEKQREGAQMCNGHKRYLFSDLHNDEYDKNGDRVGENILDFMPNQAMKNYE